MRGWDNTVAQRTNQIDIGGKTVFLHIAFGLLGGLGLFIYGMQRMAEGLQKAAGERLRHILELFTSHPVIAAFTGMLVTILVQSSSTTTVMIIGFVNAGLMNLQQALGTIMGANIGTTITAQMVSFNLQDVALPAIGIGFLVSFLARKRLHRYLGQSLLGFGLLFLGMSTMSQALVPLRNYAPFVQALINLGRHPWLGVLVGALFTMVIQSSSATTGLVIVLTMQNLITLEAGLGLVLGANIGTSITAVLAGIGANVTARRAAMAHVLFNFIGVVVFLPFLGPFTRLVRTTSAIPARQIANAHTMFNILNTLLFLPFISPFAALLARIVPGEEVILERKPKYLDWRMLGSPAAVLSATKEVVRMGELAREMIQEAVQSFVDEDRDLMKIVKQKEEIINELEREITTFLARASQEGNLTAEQSRRITRLMHMINDVERIGDHAENIVELAEQKMEEELVFSEQALGEIQEMHQHVDDIYGRAINCIRTDDSKLAIQLVGEDEIIDEMERKYRTTHIARLNEGTCMPTSGVVYLDILSNLERVADHANNLAEAVAGIL